MIFKYKDKIYDTARSSGDTSTNRLQVTEDDELKLAVVKGYFADETDYLLKNNTLEMLFDLALISARYSDLIEGLGIELTPVAGLYPEWILTDVARQEQLSEINLPVWVKSMIR